MQTITRGKDFTGNVIWKHKGCATTRFEVGVNFLRNGGVPANTDGFTLREEKLPRCTIRTWFARCSGCGGWGQLSLMKPIMGRFVSEIVCDGRCMGATRESCECSCGGMNHGGKHAA